MRTMKKLLPWLLVLPAVFVLPGRARALDAGTTYDVYAHIAGVGAHWMGTWRFLPHTPSPDGVCRYHVEWTSATTLSLSTELYLDEQQTPGFSSCAENSRRSFLTILSLSPGLPAMGFDRFQQMVQIRKMILLEDDRRVLLGTMQPARGNAFVLTAQPSSDMQPGPDVPTGEAGAPAEGDR